jgi:hypothetical protein
LNTTRSVRTTHTSAREIQRTTFFSLPTMSTPPAIHAVSFARSYAQHNFRLLELPPELLELLNSPDPPK